MFPAQTRKPENQGQEACPLPANRPRTRKDKAAAKPAGGAPPTFRPLFIKAGGGKIPRQQEKRRQRRTNQPLVGRKPHGRDVLHDNHQRRQQPCNLHPGQTRVNFFTGRGGDGHDSPILDDCFEKALFFIDFIDEKRPYQPSQASYYGKYLKMIFSHIFIYGFIFPYGK